MENKYIIIPERDLGVHEECGIIGIYSKEKKSLAKDIYLGLFALQHRGQESAGIALSMPGRRISYYKNMGLVHEVFTEEDLQLLPDSNIGIGHTRYSTTGSSNAINAQPVVFFGKHGRSALAHNGNIVNTGEIKETLLKKGHMFQSSTDSEVIATLINYLSDNSMEEGIIQACKMLNGAFSLVIIAEDKLIAIRDKHGIRPLILGKRGEDVVIASESCALDSIDAIPIRDLEPGEILSIDANGMKSIFYEKEQKKLCVFEYVYLARSDSVMDGTSVYESRLNCGKKMAELYKIDADIVAGVPDSAIVSARGYSMVSGIPQIDALSKNRYVGRTFIQPDQLQRENSVKIKLNAFKRNIDGKRLILIDDSIVRGTTSKKIISLLRASGAKEVHMLVASPMVKFPCYLGVDMDTKEQLIAGYKSKDEICKTIGADSLNYLPIEELVKSAGGGPFCTGCFNGEYGVPINSKASKFELE